MDKPSPPRIELQLERTPDFRGSRTTSSGNAAQVLYILLMMPGIMATLTATRVYPPVDPRFPKGLMLGVFLFPVAFQFLSFVVARLAGTNLWRILYVASSITLILLAILVLLNGRLDKSLRTEVKTTVIQKTVLRGRTISYDLEVSSWLPGKSVEHFNVVAKVFNRAVVGKTAIVNVHAGFFGLPWYDSISPE